MTDAEQPDDGLIRFAPYISQFPPRETDLGWLAAQLPAIEGTEPLTPHQRFFLTVVERHIGSDADRAAGVVDIPQGQVQGDRPTVIAAAERILARVNPDEMYSVYLYGQNTQGCNVDPVLVGHFSGRDLPRELAATGWWTDPDHLAARAAAIRAGGTVDDSDVRALAQSLLDIAEQAMPETYFYTDTRTELARAVLEQIEGVRAAARRQVLEEIVALAGDMPALRDLVRSTRDDPEGPTTVLPTLSRARSLLRELAAHGGPLDPNPTDKPPSQDADDTGGGS